MFQKVFEYAGPHKKGLYAATAVVLVSVLMGVLPFVLAYQVIAPLVMGAELEASFLILRVVLVLVCLVLQALLYGWGLNLSHKAAYDTLLRLRTALQKRFEKLSASGVIVFVVSHDFEFIVRTCTEVVQLDDQGAIQNHRLTPQILKTLSEKYFN